MLTLVIATWMALLLAAQESKAQIRLLVVVMILRLVDSDISKHFLTWVFDIPFAQAKSTESTNVSEKIR